jgi:transcriptional regulator with XRE-family HTH domain
MTARPRTYGELIDALENLPTALHEARRARQQTIRAAGRDAGVSFSTISRIENGKPFDVASAIAVLRYLDPETAPAEPDPPQLEQLPIDTGETP